MIPPFWNFTFLLLDMMWSTLWETPAVLGFVRFGSSMQHANGGAVADLSENPPAKTAW